MGSDLVGQGGEQRPDHAHGPVRVRTGAASVEQLRQLLDPAGGVGAAESATDGVGECR